MTTLAATTVRPAATLASGKSRLSPVAEGTAVPQRHGRPPVVATPDVQMIKPWADAMFGFKLSLQTQNRAESTGRSSHYRATCTNTGTLSLSLPARQPSPRVAGSSMPRRSAGPAQRGAGSRDDLGRAPGGSIGLARWQERGRRPPALDITIFVIYDPR